jgi:hypothetical protein
VIQIIGRSLRLHPNKINATVILPSSSNEDCNGISRFLNILSKNDSRIRKSYMNKKLGGYISINKEDNKDDDNIQESISYKYDMIYNSIGVLTNNIEIWTNTLNEVKKYIDEYNKRPSSESKNKDVKKLGKWILNQITNSQKRVKIMKNDEIYNKWNEFINDDKYYQHFISNEEIWTNTLNEVKKFIDDNNKRPSSKSKNKDVKKLGQWLQRQITNSQKRVQIMKNDEIYNKWLIYCYNKKSYLGFKDDYMDFITEKIPEILKYLCKERNISYNEDNDNTILKNKLINYASSANPLNDDELEFVNNL